MTTIAYRDGVLAGDMLVVEGTMKVGLVEKVWKTKNGVLCGYAGTLCGLGAFRHWTESGHEGKFDGGHKHDEGIMVLPDGTICIVSGEEGGGRPVPMMAAYQALGSGREIAVGAMSIGGSAEVAVSAAKENDTNTGGNVIVVKLDKRIELEKQVEEAAKAEAAKAQAAKDAIPGNQTAEESGAQLAKVIEHRQAEQAEADKQAQIKADREARKAAHKARKEKGRNKPKLAVVPKPADKFPNQLQEPVEAGGAGDPVPAA